MAQANNTTTRRFKMPALRMPDLFSPPPPPPPRQPRPAPPARTSYRDATMTSMPMQPRGLDIEMGVVRSVDDLPLNYITPDVLGVEPQSGPRSPGQWPELSYLDVYGRHIENMTGVSTDYMRNVVLRESSDNALADNPTGTARGLTQNTVDNWLSEEDGIRKWGPVLGWDEERLNMARTLDAMDPKKRDALIAKLPPASNTGDTFTSGVDTTTPEMRMAGLARNLRDGTASADWKWLREVARNPMAVGREPTFEELALLEMRNDPRWSLAVSAMQARGQHAVLSLRLGRDPEYWEMYALHFGGREGGMKILTAKDSAPISEVLSPDAIKQNAPMLKNVKTAKDFRRVLQSKFPKNWLSIQDDG